MMLSQQQSSESVGLLPGQVDPRKRISHSKNSRLEFDLAERRPKHAPPAVQVQADKLLATFAKEEERYGKEKNGNRSRRLASWKRKRDLNVKKDPYYDLAEVLLQIAIVMASVAMLSRSRPVFWFSAGLAAVGIPSFL